jgi:hypothetical protein
MVNGDGALRALLPAFGEEKDLDVGGSQEGDRQKNEMKR